MFEQRRGRHEVIMALLSLLSVSVALGAFETFPIARESGNQQSPAIDDYIVVWQTDRNGDWDIGVADISSPGAVDPQTMADPLSESQYPAVSGSVIVWENKFFMYDDRDIVGYDLAAEAFFDIQADYQDDALPAISGNLVVAQSRMTALANWNIVGIDISDHNDVQAFWIDQNDEDQWRPDVDGHLVVYEDVFDGVSYISGRDLSDVNDPAWFPIGPLGGPSESPAVAGQWAVWRDYVEGASVTAGDNLFDPRLSAPIALEGSVEASNPDVYNNVVVWQDHRNGNWDIYGYNLTTKTTFPIITNTADQTHPAITFSPSLGGYVVVWQDARDGDWDIYGAILNGPEVAGCASPLIGDVNADGVTDANDIDEVKTRLGQQNGIPPEPD